MSAPWVITALGAGSNLGNRLSNLRTALRYLKKAGPEFEIIRTSDVFETAPWGVTDQPYFLNACFLARCALSPEELLRLLKDIETKMGRGATRRWGERVIDLDILTMGSLVYDSPNLRIPHLDMHRRDFVLIPLSQILPDWVHPITKRAIADMASDFTERAPLRICGL
ncbi:MAG: 2-amino-4-hydroxy-6-hydroxymethyldihydropteridine diphosphokinase [Synergistaceae bacterium]|jgi:2-amino-4-hydroxy-6-hydroxymethyldihydropteridine diphosphokinase|nr:2-amino-4-hydroxy-6-hydroxymethyldihydropteridine diphosphokinase [Synergistaceae bacterium]